MSPKLSALRFFSATTLIVLLWAHGVVGQSGVSVNTKKQVADRFWEILVKSPRRGATFDRVYGDYVDSGHSELLLEKCRNLTLEKKDGPEAAKAWRLYGLLLERRAEPLRAVDAFEHAVHLDPNDALSPFYLAGQYIGLGRFEEAIASLEESLRRKPGRADIRTVLQTLGRTAERTGDLNRASEAWDRLEQLNPDDADIPIQIAEILESEGRLDEALRRYRRLLQRDSLDGETRVRLTLAAADLQLRLGDESSALGDFETLLDRLAPDRWLAETVRNRIERLFLQKGDEPGLAAFYRKRLEQRPNDPESVLRLAMSLRRLGDDDEARRLLEKSIETSPSNIPIRRALIDILVDRNEFDAASEQYRQIDRLAPNRSDYVIPWGELVLRRAGIGEPERKAEAIALWSRLVEAAPDDPLTAVRVADLALQHGMTEEAERFYRRAATVKPDDPSYREYLGRFYHRQRRGREAVETIRSIAEGARRNVATLMRAGSLLQSLGYVDDALDSFRGAAAAAPDDPHVLWKYAEMLVLKHDLKEALEQWVRMEPLLEQDDTFDAFLQREVRLLHGSGQLEQAGAMLESRLDAGTADERATTRMLWRLAVYRQAEGKIREAVATIEKALAVGTPSDRLLRTAAELFERNGEGKKAIEIYRRLVEQGGVWRLEHLKRLALLQLEFESAEQAVETGRRVMELGSGNAANVRFFGELLIRIGRRDDGIDVLKQALRVDPGDDATLSLLAEQLSEAGRNHEAIEFAWRLFEHAETAAGKLDLIPRLVDYYQKADRFDGLLERLRETGRGEAGRRIAALSLAEAHLERSDFAAARHVLETLSDDVNEIGSDDKLLLRRLSFVAEKQGDLSAAVRYQEALCRHDETPAELDRLFELYDKSGERKKGVDLFHRRFLLRPTRVDQLASIDRMIRREEYDAVDRVLDFLEIHDAAHWEIPYRRIALETYMKRDDVAFLVRDFWELSFPEENGPKPAPVEEEKTERIKALADLFRSGPWRLPGSLPTTDWKGVPEDMVPVVRRQEEFLLTLFRDRLLRNEEYRTPNDVPPPKPFYRVDTLAEARFLVSGWLLRNALEEGADSFREAVDECRKRFPEGTPERVRLECLLESISKVEPAPSP